MRGELARKLFDIFLGSRESDCEVCPVNEFQLISSVSLLVKQITIFV